jgi:glycosyltransferase involved in cell wall biosynthesis
VRLYQIKLPFCSSYLKLVPSAIRVLWQRQHDILVLGNDILAVDVWVNCLLARLRGGHICLWGHGFSRPDTSVRVFLRRLLINLADSILFYTQEARQQWLARGVPGEKLFVAPNALDTDHIARVRHSLTRSKLESFRQTHGLGGKSIVIFCGRLMERKRPEIVLQAMALVVQARPQAHALVIGDGPLRCAMKNLCRQLGLSRAVSFFGAVFDETTLARCFLCSQAAIIPAAAGLNIQHAFSYGIPVIVGDEMQGHGPEIALVKEEVTGLFSRSGDPASFAQAICRLFESECLQRRMGRAALQLIEEKFNVALMAKGFWQAVDHCLVPYGIAKRSDSRH